MNYLEWADRHYGFIKKLGCRVVSTGGGVKDEKHCAYDTIETKNISSELLARIESHSKKQRADGLKFEKISHMEFNDGTTLIRIDYR